MAAMTRCGGCGYIPKGNGKSVLECSPCGRPLGKLRMLPEVVKDKKGIVVSCCGQRWSGSKDEQ